MPTIAIPPPDSATSHPCSINGVTPTELNVIRPKLLGFLDRHFLSKASIEQGQNQFYGGGAPGPGGDGAAGRGQQEQQRGGRAAPRQLRRR